LKGLFDSTVPLKIFGVAAILIGIFWVVYRSKVDAILAFIVAAACFGVAWLGDHYGVIKR